MTWLFLHHFISTHVDDESNNMLMISVFIMWCLDGEHWEDSLTPFLPELEKVYTIKWQV